MKNKILIFNLMFLLFFMSFISANTLTNYKPQEVNVEFNFTQTCEDATYITLSTIASPNSTEIINTNMTSVGGGSFLYNNTPNQIGRYDFTGISDGCLNTFAVYVEVTADGNVYNTGDSLIRIFVAIFFVLMMIGVYASTKKIDYEKWYDKIQKKYITRNFVKWALAAIAYNIMKNAFIVYFLLGLPIMLILTDLVFIYNITSIALYMNAILAVYIIGVIILGVVFLSFVQEWFMDAIKQIQDTDWGIDNAK